MTGRFLLGAIFAVGCVSKATYATLETSYDAAVAARDKAQAEQDVCGADLLRLQEAEARHLASLRSLHEALARIGDAGPATLHVEDGRMLLRLEGDALFAPARADLTDAGRQTLAALAPLLASVADHHFVVEGHTDTDRLDSKEFPTPWHLGADRAIQVVLALVDAGFPAERVSAASRAATVPVAAEADPLGPAANRRIDIVWVPEAAESLREALGPPG